MNKLLYIILLTSLTLNLANANQKPLLSEPTFIEKELSRLSLDEQNYVKSLISKRNQADTEIRDEIKNYNKKRRELYKSLSERAKSQLNEDRKEMKKLSSIARKALFRIEKHNNLRVKKPANPIKPKLMEKVTTLD